MWDAARQSVAWLEHVVEQEGQGVPGPHGAGLYNNYAIFGTPLEKIYGDNVARLAEIREKYDPKNVMGLAGGWKFSGRGARGWEL